jgi:hypothetical protein
MALVAQIMADEASSDESKLARIRQELDISQQSGSSENKPYVSYIEWADVHEDIKAIAKQDRVSCGKVIRDATRLFTTLHQPPTNNASTYADSLNTRTTPPKPSRRKRKD